MSDVWKQGARSPLSGEGTTVLPPHAPRPLLQCCSYDRLQLLQSICPAAAAAVIILGRQMPEMRSGGAPPSSGQQQQPLFTVSADAWCPRALMLAEPAEESLIFSTSGSGVS